jgi:hypothetical protein
MSFHDSLFCPYWISCFLYFLPLLFPLTLWVAWELFFINFLSISPSLSQGGTPARFLIIDDGWQDTTNEFQKEGEPFVEGSQ